jgi:hypothetical protein
MNPVWKKWLDVAVFVVVATSGAFFAATGKGSGREMTVAAVTRADDGRRRIDEALDQENYDRTEGATILAALRGQGKVIMNDWRRTPTAATPKGLVFYHPATLEDVRTGREAEIRLLPPLSVSARAEQGSISVAWSSNDRTTAAIAEYVVYRRDETNPEREMARVAGDMTTFVDTSVKPGVVYFYCIAARSSEPALVGVGKDVSEKSEPVSERAQRDFEIKLVRADIATQSGRFLVRRIIDGVWHEKEFDAKAGDAIGATDAGSLIDYSTACRVIDLRIVAEVANEVREDVVFAADGSVIVEAGQVKKKAVQVPRERRFLVGAFTNELGEREELRVIQ